MRSVGGWLHQVIYRLAAKAKTDAAQRRVQERRGRVLPDQEESTPEFSVKSLAAVVDEELLTLSEMYREPLVLCYLEGKTAGQTARRLGCSLRTLHRRLERGRQLLRARLTGRGLDLPAGLLAVGLTLGPAATAVPAALAQSTVKAALVYTAGPVASGLISARAVNLARRLSGPFAWTRRS